MERASLSSLTNNRAKRYAGRLTMRLLALCALIFLFFALNSTVYQTMSWRTALEAKTEEQTKRMEALIMRQNELDFRVQLLEKKLESVSEKAIANALQESVYQVEKKVNMLEPLLTYVASLLQQSLRTDLNPAVASKRDEASQRGQSYPLNQNALMKQRAASRFESESANLLVGGNDPSIDMVLSQVAKKSLRGGQLNTINSQNNPARTNSVYQDNSFGSLSADLLVGEGSLTRPEGNQVDIMKQEEINGKAPESSSNDIPPTVNEIDDSMLPNYRKIQEYLAAHPVQGEAHRDETATVLSKDFNNGILKE